MPRLRSALAVLALLLPAHAASTQWSSNPALNLVVADGPSEQVLPKLATTPAGDCYVGWFDISTGSYTVRCQHLDAQGNELWPHNGVLVSNHPQNTSLVDWDLIADSSGGCVLAFTDIRDGGDLDVFAYRLDAAGNFLWGADGVQLSVNSDFDPNPRIAETSTGDFVFVWGRSPNVGDGTILMQRLSPAGLPQNPAGGVTIVSVPGETPGFPAVVAAQNGSVIVSWLRNIKTFASPRHLRARRFNADGTTPWAAPVVVYDLLSLPIAYQPGLKSDGNGGAILWWHRSDLGGTYNAFVQRLGPTGTELFAHEGVAVASTATNHIDPSLGFDPASGDLFVSWTEENANQSAWGIYGQRISAAGVPQWGAGGKAFVAVSGVFKFLSRAVALGDGAIVTYADEPTGQFGKDRALAFRTDAAGNFVWAGSPIVLSSVLATKSRLPTVIDGNGVVKTVWEDDRNGTPDLVGQSVNPDGALGNEPGAWTDLGSGLAGISGVPKLTGIGSLVAGSATSLTLVDAKPSALAIMFVSLLSAPTPFKGGTLVPVPPLLSLSLVTQADGTRALAFSWPAAVPPGTMLWFQDAISDLAAVQKVSLSNALEAVTP